jgi:hypothetical protein
MHVMIGMVIAQGWDGFHPQPPAPCRHLDAQRAIAAQDLMVGIMAIYDSRKLRRTAVRHWPQPIPLEAEYWQAK